MAIVRVHSEGLTLNQPEEIRAFLARHGIDYEQWTPDQPVAADAPADDVLAAYAQEVEALKARGGYVTADVIDVNADTPNLDAMLAKFSREHWHDEDEVRFIVEGRGLFHVHPQSGPVFAIEVEAGDLDSRAARHAPLVRSVRRPTDPRDSTVPGSVGLDAALHRQRRRPGLPAGVLRTELPAGADRAHVTEIRGGRASARSCSISRAPPRRSRSSTRGSFRTRGPTSQPISSSTPNRRTTMLCSPVCVTSTRGRRRPARRSPDGPMVLEAQEWQRRWPTSSGSWTATARARR